jgi:hypothetical protein
VSQYRRDDVTAHERPASPKQPPATTPTDVRRWFTGPQRALEICSIPSVGDFIERRCQDRYMVTLTDRRKLSAGELSRDVRWTLHRTNEAFFGTHYKRHRRVFLATYAVQEATLNEGLHAHIIVGVPTGSLDLKPFKPKLTVPDYIVTTWRLAAPGYRRGQAQDWRPADQVGGAFSYVEKTFWAAAGIDPLDLVNTTFPTEYAAPARG